MPRVLPPRLPRLRRTRLIALLVLAALAPALSAQESGPQGTRRGAFDRLGADLEPSTFALGATTFHLPGSPLRADSAAYSIEASVAPAFTVLELAPGDPVPGIFRLHAVPKFLVRRLDGIGSYPVRTPGYQPTVILYYSPRDSLAAGADRWYLSLAAQHHSNGQTGPFLGADGPNHVDGSFSLWSAAAALHLHTEWRWLPEYKALHVEHVFNKEGLLEPLYPDWVVALRLRTRHRSHGGPPGIAGRARLLADLEWRPRRDNAWPDAWKPAPFAATLTTTWSPLPTSAFAMDAAFFARFYAGFDYYNMNFDRTIRRLDFGLFFLPGM